MKSAAPTPASDQGGLSSPMGGKSTCTSNTYSRFRPGAPTAIYCEPRSLSNYQHAVCPRLFLKFHPVKNLRCKRGITHWFPNATSRPLRWLKNNSFWLSLVGKGMPGRYGWLRRVLAYLLRLWFGDRGKTEGEEEICSRRWCLYLAIDAWAAFPDYHRRHLEHVLAQQRLSERLPIAVTDESYRGRCQKIPTDPSNVT